MKIRSAAGVGLAWVLTFPTLLLAAECVPMEREPHFHKISETNAVNVFTLKLGRLESTQSVCQNHPFFYVVTSESESTDTLGGHAGISHQWYPGQARFVATPEVHVIRNETSTPHSEVIVELLTKLQFNPFADNYDQDNFSAEPLSASWSIAVEHGAMTAVKSQLARGDKLDVPSFTRMVIALNDLTLHALGKDFQMSKQDVQVLAPESDFTITNAGRFPARFVTIAF